VDTARATTRLHRTLWTVQILVALVFVATGVMKVTRPIERLPATLATVPLPLVRLLGCVVHFTRNELAALAVPVVLGALSALVAWGRWRQAPILAR
jgi:uncharacterized membrane protein YphA (DoxX/SURF4 family)